MLLKWKIVATVIVAIAIASTLLGYYLESQSPGPSPGPSVTYDFTKTPGDFLGWNVSGYVSNLRNESDGVTIHVGGVLSRQFKALNSNVKVSLNWTINAVMVISRQLDGNYDNLSPITYSSDTEFSYTNTTSFHVDNGTTFMVQFEGIPSFAILTFIYGVQLWNCAELP